MKTFTISQASKYSKVPIETITNWIDKGILKVDIAGGGHRRISKEDLDHLLQKKDIEPGDLSLVDRKKILVVDDDKIIVETIVQSLEEDEHAYELISATDGFEAEAQVKHFMPDILILDIMMPDIDGYEVCKKIKSDPKTKNIKIIVLSAYLDDENYKKMKEYGADSCFSKPLPLPKLRKEVAKLLD